VRSDADALTRMSSMAFPYTLKKRNEGVITYLKEILDQFAPTSVVTCCLCCFEPALPETEALALRTAFPCQAQDSISIIQLCIRANMRHSTFRCWSGSQAIWSCWSSRRNGRMNQGGSNYSAFCRGC
jgi:hypothetical protein